MTPTNNDPKPDKNELDEIGTVSYLFMQRIKNKDYVNITALEKAEADLSKILVEAKQAGWDEAFDKIFNSVQPKKEKSK